MAATRRAGKLIELGPHDKMSPAQALAFASREEWDDIVIVGFHKDKGGSLVVRSSHMSREFALWIAEHMKLHAMDCL